MLWSFVWYMAQNPNAACVDGVMNGFSLHIEPPSYIIRSNLLQDSQAFLKCFVLLCLQLIMLLWFQRSKTDTLCNVIIHVRRHVWRQNTIVFNIWCCSSYEVKQNVYSIRGFATTVTIIFCFTRWKKCYIHFTHFHILYLYIYHITLKLLSSTILVIGTRHYITLLK